MQAELSTPVAQLDVSGISSVVAGACSGAITVTQEDDSGTPISLTTATSVALGSLGSGSFYSDAGCSSLITTATIPAGSTSTPLYFKDTVAEVLAPTFTTSPISANHAVTVSADTPTRLTFSAAATTYATTCTAVSVERRDQYGNLASPASATTVTLGGVGNGHFYTTNTCSSTATTASIASGTSSKTIYYADSYVETGLTLTGTGLPTTASHGLTITGPFAQGTTITTATSGFPSDNNTLSLASADFDGDGKPDLVTTDAFGSNHAYVAWGNGAGSVTSGLVLNTGSTPGGVAAISLRQNAKYDIIVSNYGAAAGSANTTIILGNGDRTFAAPATLDSGGTMRYTNGAAGGANLLNSGGKLDLVVTYFGDATTYVGAGMDIYPGNGDGTFGSPTSFQLNGVGYSWPTVGDIDDDGGNDVVVPLYANGGANAAIYHNDGGGSFTKTLSNPGVGNYGNSFVYGDFNGDALLDYALGLSNYGLFADTGSIGAVGNHANTMGNMTINDGNSVRALTGAFSSSGHQDIVFIQQTTAQPYNGIILFPGNGDGTFGSPIFYPVGAKATDAVKGDFNGDGKLDVMVLTIDGELHFFAGQ